VQRRGCGRRSTLGGLHDRGAGGNGDLVVVDLQLDGFLLGMARLFQASPAAQVPRLNHSRSTALKRQILEAPAALDAPQLVDQVRLAAHAADH
jgi:hypothetical protein